MQPTLKGNSKLGTVANFISELTGIISEFITMMMMITICVCVCIHVCVYVYMCACLLVEGRKQLLVSLLGIACLSYKSGSLIGLKLIK